jgi:hypothetical protein
VVALGAIYAAVVVAALPIDGPDGSFADDLGRPAGQRQRQRQPAHTMFAIPAYLRHVAPPDAQRERAERAAEQRDEVRRLAREDQVRALELGIGRPDLPDSFDGGLVDLNNARPRRSRPFPASTARSPTASSPCGRRSTASPSLEDAAHVLDLDAPLVDRIRRHVVVLPRGVDEM